MFCASLHLKAVFRAARTRWTFVAAAVLAATSLCAETTVKTIGGGRVTITGPDAGFTNGDVMQSSQFHTPAGCLVDSQGLLYVADRDNGAIRKLNLPANRATTLMSGLNKPVALVMDSQQQ